MHTIGQYNPIGELEDGILWMANADLRSHSNNCLLKVTKSRVICMLLDQFDQFHNSKPARLSLYNSFGFKKPTSATCLGSS